MHLSRNARMCHRYAGSCLLRRMDGPMCDNVRDCVFLFENYGVSFIFRRILTKIMPFFYYISTLKCVWKSGQKKHFFSWDFIRGQLSASSGNEFPLVSFTVSLRVAACVRQKPRIGIRRNVTMIVTPRASILRRHLTSLDSV